MPPAGLPPQRPPIQRERPRGVDSVNAQLTAYLTARAIDGRPVEGQDLQRLQRADSAVQWSRQTLIHGRANVQADTVATAGESFERGVVAHDFLANELPVMVEGDVRTEDRAAAAVAAGAGTCDDFAAVTAVCLAHQPIEQETVQVMSSLSVKHSWAQTTHEPPEGASAADVAAATARTILVDGWAQGPAVYSEDSSATYKLDLAPTRSIGHEAAAEVIDRFRSTYAHIAGPLGRQVAAELSRKDLAQEVRPPTSQVLWPTCVMSQAFASSARSKMAHGGGGEQGVRNRVEQARAQDNPQARPPPLLNPDIRTSLDFSGNSLRDNLAAVSAARAMGANVSGAVQQAPIFLDAVRRLPDIPNYPPPVRSR